MLSQESKEKMKLWLSLWPESGHPADEKRKDDFINSLNANNETVDFNDLYDYYREIKPELLDDVAKERCREWIEEICNSQAKKING